MRRTAPSFSDELMELRGVIRLPLALRDAAGILKGGLRLLCPGEVLQDFHVARQHRVPREIIAFAQNLAQPPEARLNEAKDRSVEAPRMRQSALGIIGRQRISPAGGLVGGRSLRALLFFELRRQSGKSLRFCARRIEQTEQIPFSQGPDARGESEQR